MAIECTQCGVRSELETLFVVARRAFSRKRHTLCPRCVQRRQLKEVGQVQRLALGALAICAAGIWLEGKPNAADRLLFLALLLTAYAPALLVHELGHAAVARALGLRLFGVVIGFGDPLWSGRVLGIPVEWRRVPAGGITRAALVTARRARRNMAALALGGPAANALAAALVWPALPADAFHATPSGLGQALAVSWFGIHVVLAGSNLVPLRHPSTWGVLSSDGLLILQALCAKAATVREWLVARFYLEASIAREAGRVEHALASVREGLASHPGDPALTSLLGVCLVDTGASESARDVFQGQLTAELAPIDRAVTLSNLAWCDFVSARDEWLDEALQCSQEAWAQLGWLSPIQNTRAAVLVWADRAAEALPLARAALEGPIAPADRARVACVLALAYAALGQRDDAKQALEQARSHDADCFLIARADAATR